MRGLLIALGSICVALGVMGMFLPLLPTTPFLLLAAACYARSSPKFYQWLIDHRWFGEYIRSFRSKQGVPRRVKMKAITFLWLTMGVSGYWMRDNSLALTILIVCGAGITIFLLRLPTASGD